VSHWLHPPAAPLMQSYACRNGGIHVRRRIAVLPRLVEWARRGLGASRTSSLTSQLSELTVTSPRCKRWSCSALLLSFCPARSAVPHRSLL
jgi:hypothetical protein